MLKKYLIGWVVALSTVYAGEVKDFNFPSPSVEGTKPVKVYLPDGYKESENTKYRLMIYMHGSLGNNHSFMSSVLKPAADQLISSGAILPVIIVMPDIQLTTPSVNFGNRHMYENSEYYGKYSDVIKLDLMNWLKNESTLNLKNKISFKRGTMAIAGFSMGGDGALRIGLKNPEMFIAIGAHGAVPSLALPLISGGIVPAVLNENRNSKDANGNYIFKAENGAFTTTIFGVSAAWNKLSPGGDIQFLVNPNGSLNSDVYNAWLPVADSKTLIQSKGLYSTSTTNPYIYLEVGSADSFKGFNDFFVANELPALKVDPKYYIYNVTAGAPHGFDVRRASDALSWLSSKMETVTAVKDLTLEVGMRVTPNPVHTERVTAQFRLKKSADVSGNLFDISGRFVKSTGKKQLSAGQNELSLGVDELPAGMYLYRLSLPNGQATQKVVIE